MSATTPRLPPRSVRSPRSCSPAPFPHAHFHPRTLGTQAYEDIAPVLHHVADAMGKAPQDLRIYDPYFCHGGAARKLRRLGFACVYNKNQDFYQAIQDGAVPEFDILVTNPPVGRREQGSGRERAGCIRA